MSVRLTKTIVDKTQPADTDVWLWDTTLPSFGLRVRPGGSKTFVVRYRTTSGTQRKLTLGRADVLRVEDARDLAREALAKAAKGGDPTTDRREKRESPSVADLSERFQLEHGSKVKPRTKANYEALWRLHILPVLGSKRVADVTHADISRFHATVETGKVNANRCLDLLSNAFHFAERIGWRPKNTCPTDGIAPFAERDRQRILTAEEIKRLWSVLDEVDTEKPEVWSVTWLVRILMLSGLRMREWSCAAWEWVDFDRATLSLPDTKTGARVVHLSDAVLELLAKVPRIGPWIFPTARGDKPLVYPFQHWERIRARAGLPDVRIHDLRHTLGSLGHIAGLSQREVADLLGHRQMSTTERYLHVYDVRKRQAANRAAESVLSSVSK